MTCILDDKKFLTEEEFHKIEKENESSVKTFFYENCSKGDQQFKARYEREFITKLNDTKIIISELHKNKCQLITSETKELIKTIVEEFEQRFKDIYSEFESMTDLDINLDQEIKECITKFKDNCPYNDIEFLKSYLEQLDKELLKSKNDIKRRFDERLKRFDNEFQIKVNQLKDNYIEVRIKLNDNLTDIHYDYRYLTTDSHQMSYSVTKYSNNFVRKLLKI